jgi:hypothetical protein
MKDFIFDAKLVAARPEKYKINTSFTNKVIGSIQSSEILSSSIRKTNVNKETFIMKFKHLPKLAILAIALGVLLVLSGTAYATYQLLWPKPDVTVSQPTTSENGRSEVALSLAECGKTSLGDRYELKKNATITADEIPMVVKARCELDAIGTWAQATFPHDDHYAPIIDNRAYDKIDIYTSMATHIKSRSEHSITFTGLTKYNQEDVIRDLPSSVRFIADSRDVSPDTIKDGDPVVYIESQKQRMVPKNCTEGSCSVSGTPTSNTLVAVVKLSMPFEHYDQFAWQSLTEKQTCYGNPDDTCLTGFAGAIDLYMGSAQVKINETVMKQIQGVITKIDGKTVVIRSSSGTLFTITTPTDVISSYNTNKASQYYNNQKVGVGSSLAVGYAEKESEHSKSLNASHLQSVQLQIEIVGKSDPVKSY